MFGQGPDAAKEKSKEAMGKSQAEGAEDDAQKHSKEKDIHDDDDGYRIE